MRLGVLLPHRGVVIQSARRPPVEQCLTVARMADAAGMDVWVGDSIVAKPRLEPLTTLANPVARHACASNTIENHEFTISKILPTLCYVVGINDVLAALK